MELEFERKLQEIRNENRKFTVQLISAVAAVAGVAPAPWRRHRSVPHGRSLGGS